MLIWTTGISGSSPPLPCNSSLQLWSLETNLRISEYCNPWAVSSAKQRPGDTIKHPLSFKSSCTRTKRGDNTRGKMVFLLWKKNNGIVFTLLFHASLATLYRVVAILFKDKSETWDSALPAGQKLNFLPLVDQSRPWWSPANIHKEPWPPPASP